MFSIPLPSLARFITFAMCNGPRLLIWTWNDVWWGGLGIVGHPRLVISLLFIAYGVATENTWLSLICARSLYQMSMKVINAAMISGQEMISWKKKTQREWSLHFENSQGELHLDLRFATVNLGIGQIFWCKSLKLIITTKVTSSALIFGHGRSWGSEELSEFSRETTGKAELRLNLRHLTPDTCSLFAVTFC